MDRIEVGPSAGEAEALLARYQQAQAVFRGYAPRATVSALMLFTHMARRTFNDGTMDLPSQTEMAKAIDVSLSGINHLLTTLTSKGRVKGGGSASKEGGYGLIETVDWIPGLRSFPYVLTPKGRKCLEQMVQALAGNQEIEIPVAHDMDSLVKLIMFKQPPSKGGEKLSADSQKKQPSSV